MLTGLQALRSAAWSGLAASAALIGCVFLGAELGGLPGAAWGLAAGGVAGVFARLTPVRDALRRAGLRMWQPPGHGAYGVLRRVSAPIALMNALWMPASWIASVLLARSPGGYVELGHLGVANQWFAALLFVPNVLGFSTLPLLSESNLQSAQAFAAARRLALHVSITVALPLAVVTALASPWIMGFYGQEYREAWPVLAVLSLATVPHAMFSVVANVLTVTGQSRTLVGAQVAWAVPYVAVTFWLLQQAHGALALAVAMTVGNVLRIWVAGRA
jgi:O-antigen/teichoic acid export membrane protein